LTALTAQQVGARVTAQSAPAPIEMAGDAVWQFEDDRRKLEEQPNKKKEDDIWDMVSVCVCVCVCV
jgi:hypothetical protein